MAWSTRRSFLFAAMDDGKAGGGSAIPLKIPCPGHAHVTGGVCAVCDPESEGTIEVYVTDAECDALEAATEARPFDPGFARRLLRLRLLEASGEGYVATPLGKAVAEMRRRGLD